MKKKERPLNRFFCRKLKTAFFPLEKRPVFFKALSAIILTGMLFFSVGIRMGHAQKLSNTVAQIPFLGEVKAVQTLNIRAGQSTNFEQIGQLSAGEKFVVTQESFGWYKIKLPVHAESFVSSAYVKKLEEGIGEINGNRLNIRARPKPEATVLGQLQKGELVRILKEEAAGWLKIEPPENSYGWVAVEYVQYVSSELPAPRVVEPPVRNVYAKKRLEEQKAAELAAEKERALAEVRKNQVTAEGVVVDLGEQALANDIRHRLIIDDKTGYYLQGYRRIFDIFLQNKVQVEGTLKPGTDATRPVIFVSKILFVL